MKYIVTVFQILILYMFYYAGVIVQELLRIPIPGSIIGLVLLFLCLYIKLIPINTINRGAGFLIAILPLLFVPVCIGVMKYPILLSIKGLSIIFVVFVSSVFTLLIAGGTSQLLEKLMTYRKEQNEWENY